MSLGILSDSTLPLPILLDTVRHSETGHLSLDQARTARSRAGAIGPYQFLERFLPEFGYGMPTDIPVADVQDPDRARELAGQYITGYSLHHNFRTPLQKLVAYNMGPSAAAKWIARGENIDELPLETQQYITRAAEYLTQNQQPTTEEPQMANNTLLGLPFDMEQFEVLSGMAARGNPMAAAAVEQMANEEMNRRRAAAQSVETTAPQGGALSTAANAQSPNPALTTVQAAPAPPTSAPVRIPITQNNGFSMNPMPPATNRRDQSMLAMPTAPKSNFNDMLIRMGAAGLDASAEGGLQALGAIGQAYGDIKSEEASAALEIYKAQLKAMGKKKGGGGAAASGAAIVNDDIGRALTLLQDDNEGFFTNLFQGDLLPATGFGAYLAGLPNTDAKALSNKLRTIQANISFDKLQAMREASPTGGALGQVSTFELQNLMAVFGSLEQSQSNEELQYNLRRLQQVYNDIVHGPGNHQYGSFSTGGQPSGMTSSNLNAARAIVAGQP